MAQPLPPGEPAGAGRAAPRGASPAGTLLRSIAFPGWGQLENDRPLKAAAVFAIEGGFLASGFVEYRRAEQSKDDELAAALRGDAAEAGQHYQRYLDRRNRAVTRFWWSVFSMMMSMIDAYTDAHLRDFVPAPVPELEPEGGEGSSVAPPPAEPKLDLGLVLDPAPQRAGIAVRF